MMFRSFLLLLIAAGTINTIFSEQEIEVKVSEVERMRLVSDRKLLRSGRGAISTTPRQIKSNPKQATRQKASPNQLMQTRKGLPKANVKANRKAIPGRKAKAKANANAGKATPQKSGGGGPIAPQTLRPAVVLGPIGMRPWNKARGFLDRSAKWIGPNNQAMTHYPAGPAGIYVFKYQNTRNVPLLATLDVICDNRCAITLNGALVGNQVGGWGPT